MPKGIAMLPFFVVMNLQVESDRENKKKNESISGQYVPAVSMRR